MHDVARARAHAYDPFAAGPHAVSVRTVEIGDAARRLTVEVWEPAGARPDPLVVFSHTSGGHRRQFSILCEHLASHGYVVAAPDHAGSTADDRARRATRPEPWTQAETDALVAQWIADRPRDLSRVIDSFGADGRVAAVGVSFGGWAVLALPETDRRVAAIVAMAPGGSSRPLPGIIPAKLTFEWGRDVPTLFLAAERDRFVPVDRVGELLERARGTKRMVTLGAADHGHFGDDVNPAAGESSAEDAHAFAKALTLAHLDAHLRGGAGSRAFLDGDVISRLAERGIRAK